MAISHNPIFNRAMSSAEAKAAQDRAQAEVDAQFAQIVSQQTPMTVEGAAGKVLGMFALVVGSAAITWFGIQNGLIPAGAILPLVFGSMIVAAGLMFFASLSRKVRKGAMLAYSVLEGIFLGALSLLFEVMYPGIVQSAVISTLATAGIMFAAYRFGFIKVNARFTRVMTFALLGYLGFAVINLVVSLFTSGAGIYTTQFGWIAALIGAGLAAFSLNLDFEAIAQGAAKRLPAENEWRAAFGLVTTLIWLYMEILRLLAIFNRD